MKIYCKYQVSFIINEKFNKGFADLQLGNDGKYTHKLYHLDFSMKAKELIFKDPLSSEIIINGF